MKVHSERRANRIVVRGEGSLDGAGAAVLEPAVAGLLAADDHLPVVLDLAAVPAVDAAAAYHEEIADAAKAAQLEAHNRYNQRIYQALNRQMEQGEGVALSMTDMYRATAYGAPIPALKSFVMSPYVDEASMDHLLLCLDRARAEVAREG